MSINKCKYCGECVGEQFYHNPATEEVAHFECHEDDKYGV